MTFSPQDDAAILLGGWDDRTLADMLFMSVTTLRDRRRELTAPPRIPCTPRPPQSFKPREQYIYWSIQQDRLLGRLLSEGLTFRQIGERMGRNRLSTKSRAKKLRQGRA